MFDFGTWVSGLIWLLPVSIGTWLVSVKNRNVSIVDILWAPMFVVLAIGYLYSSGTDVRGIVVTSLITLWAVRLAGYIAFRSRGEPEDYRYRTIRKNNEPGFWFKSLYIVFILQAVIAWVVSLPLLASITSTSPLNWLDMLGVAIVVFGISYEAVADFQLYRFRVDPASHGKVLDSGLWRLSRHPNYFGNACIWWGLFLIAASAGAYWSVVSPILMTWLLLKFSGVALLEKTIVDRRTGYTDYIARTNSFFPGPKRLGKA